MYCEYSKISLISFPYFLPFFIDLKLLLCFTLQRKSSDMAKISVKTKKTQNGSVAKLPEFKFRVSTTTHYPMNIRIFHIGSIPSKCAKNGKILWVHFHFTYSRIDIHTLL